MAMNRYPWHCLVCHEYVPHRGFFQRMPVTWQARCSKRVRGGGNPVGIDGSNKAQMERLEKGAQ